MAIEAGDVVWTITGDSRKLDAALKKGKAGAAGLAASFKKHSRAIGAGMTVMGGVIVGVMGKVLTSFAKTGDEIQKMAIRTGFSTEALSELGFAAERGGASLEDIEKATKKLSQTIFEASEGTSTYVDALAGVGLTYDDIAGKSPEEQFLIVANALAEVEDQTVKVALAQEIFGRAGTKLLPMLADGAAGLEEMRQKARDLGLVFDQEAANKAADFQDAITNLQGALQGFVVQIGPILADVVIPFIERMVAGAKSTSDWAKANPGLTSTIVKIVGAVGALMLFLGPLVIMMPGLISIFGLFSGALGLAGAAGAAGLLATAIGPLGLVIAIGAAVFATWQAIEAFGEMRRAQDLLLERTQAWGGQVQLVVGRLREMGIAVDASTLAGKSEAEQLDVLNGIMRKARADRLAAKQATDKGTGAVEDSTEALDESTTALDTNRQQIDQSTGTLRGFGTITFDVFGAVDDLTGGLDDGTEALGENAGALDSATGFAWSAGSAYWNVGQNAFHAADGIAAMNRELAKTPKGGGFASGGVVPGFAAGGVIPSFALGGRIVQVGEMGPELAFLPVGTRVLSHSDSKQAVQEAVRGSDSPDMTFTFGDIIVQGSDNPGQTAKDIVDEIKVEMGRQLREAQATF